MIRVDGLTAYASMRAILISKMLPRCIILRNLEFGDGGSQRRNYQVRQLVFVSNASFRSGRQDWTSTMRLIYLGWTMTVEEHRAVLVEA
jgi:hypothetical protein